MSYFPDSDFSNSYSYPFQEVLEYTQTDNIEQIHFLDNSYSLSEFFLNKNTPLYTYLAETILRDEREELFSQQDNELIFAKKLLYYVHSQEVAKLAFEYLDDLVNTADDCGKTLYFVSGLLAETRPEPPRITLFVDKQELKDKIYDYCRRAHFAGEKNASPIFARLTLMHLASVIQINDYALAYKILHTAADEGNIHAQIHLAYQFIYENKPSNMLIRMHINSRKNFLETCAQTFPFARACIDRLKNERTYDFNG